MKNNNLFHSSLNEVWKVLIFVVDIERKNNKQILYKPVIFSFSPPLPPLFLSFSLSFSLPLPPLQVTV